MREMEPRHDQVAFRPAHGEATAHPDLSALDGTVGVNDEHQRGWSLLDGFIGHERQAGGDVQRRRAQPDGTLTEVAIDVEGGANRNDKIVAGEQPNGHSW